MTARLGNALYWVFCGLGVLLLLPAVVISATGEVPVTALWAVWLFFGMLAGIAWLVGSTCHCVLGGDASALWERGFIARERRSLEFRKFCATAAFLVVGGVAWLIVEGQRQDALGEQRYERQRQADERREAQQAEAERQAEAREAAQRKAAQQEEVQREEEQRAATISATDLSVSK
jgi:hypothetical protein